MAAPAKDEQSGFPVSPLRGFQEASLPGQSDWIRNQLHDLVIIQSF